jgi:Rieske Fe-S protein
VWNLSRHGELGSWSGRLKQHGLDERGSDMTDRDQPIQAPGTTRRALLLGAGAIGAAGVLAACASSNPAPPTTNGGNGGEAPASPQPIKVTDIPVGGGAIFPDQNAVVTQLTAGQFKAYSATCTHEQCLVSRIQSAVIICPCHGSQYNIADGSVAVGPATRPLPARTATVSGDTITVS